MPGVVVSGSRIVSRRSGSLLMGHVCSQCGAIVLQSISINVRYEEPYSFFIKSKAQAAASEGSLSALKATIGRINSCAQTNFVLRDGPQTDVSGFVELRGVCAPCPCCERLEPWQNPVATYDERAVLDKIHYPVVLDSDVAHKWVQAIVSQLNEQVNFARRDVSRIKTAQERVEKLRDELNALSLDLHNLSLTLPACKKKASLTTVIDSLNDKLNNFRFSGNFKEKRELKESLRAAKKELEETENEIKSKTSLVKKQIASKQTEYRQMFAVAYGYTGKVTETRRNGAICYELEVASPQ